MPTDASLLTEMVYGLGSGALAAFFVALVLLCWTATGLWGLTQHYWVPRLRSSWPPTLFLLVHLIFGFALVVAAAGVFALLAQGLGDGSSVARLDEVFSGAIRQNTSRETLQAFALLTQFGDTATLLVLLLVVSVALALLNRQWLVLPWALALLGNWLLNATLKNFFARARPVHEHELVVTHGWSFPSGHASGAVVAYGMLAYLALRLLPAHWVRRAGLPLLLAAITIAFTTACSRVFLQVHYASDVIAGAASGLAWLLVCICSAELARHYHQTRRA
ncbi:MAG: phosphatase PAP2 family protein [Pseudomonadota bacterium]